VRIFKTKWTARYTRRERISDRSLREAIERAGRGTIDADLGGGIIKQRVARSGQGRSGGYRMMIAYRAGTRAVFLYAFAKKRAREHRPRRIADLAGDRGNVAYGGRAAYRAGPRSRDFAGGDQ
jgi:hypothetical protein